MIRIIIADDHPIVREGLKRIIHECPDMTLVAEADNGGQAIEACRLHNPDVLCLDISMPGPGLLDMIKQVKTGLPGIRILILSIHPDQHYAVRSIRAGASGYLNKQNSTEELATAIRKIMQNHKYISAELAADLLDNKGYGETLAAEELLSDREFQVLCELARGKTIGLIAKEWSLSPKTVSTYKNRLQAKLKLSSIADIVSYALSHGLVDRPDQ